MGKKKILVIDYDQASLQALEQVLVQEGFDVVLAGDGQAGWEKYQSEKPDLVLLEAMLSKIHGFELCDRITKDPSTNIPVFIMTGVYKDRIYRTEALRTYGASEYFEKPLDMPKFLASIHGVLTVPDIKPETREDEDEALQAISAMKPIQEEPRRPQPAPEVRAASVKPAFETRLSRDERPRFETGPHSAPGREEREPAEAAPEPRPVKESLPKIRIAPASKLPGDGEIRLESLLNIRPEKEEGRRSEPAKAAGHPPAVPKDHGGRAHDAVKKESETEDIDALLKETLADFGLEHEKKRAAKAPPKPELKPEPVPEKPKIEPPPPAAPLKAKPAPAPVAPAPSVFEKPKPGPQAHPAPTPFAFAEKLKPTPPPPMPPAVAEKQKPAPPSMQAQPQARPAAHAHAPEPPAAARPVGPAPFQRLETETSPWAEPKKPEKRAETPARGEPVRPAEPRRGPEPRMFKDIYEIDKKKSVSPVLAVAAGLVVVAAVGFLILRPKHAAKPAEVVTHNPAAVTQSTPSEETADNANNAIPPLPEEKLKAVSPKPKPAPAAVQTRQEPLPGPADAIIPAQPASVDHLRLPAAGPQKKTATTTAQQKPAETTPAGTGAGEDKSAQAQTQGQAGQPVAAPAKPETGPAQPPTQTPQQTPAQTAAQGSTAGGDELKNQSLLTAKAIFGQLVDLDTVDEPPQVIKSFEPVYPSAALRFGKEGSVTINALISETGNVIRTGILKGLQDDMGLEQAAQDAVKRWKFQPAKKDGVAVKVWKPIVITFKMSR